MDSAHLQEVRRPVHFHSPDNVSASMLPLHPHVNAVPLHTHARAIGNKLLLLGHIAVILDAFYQTCLYAEIHLLMHHGGYLDARIQARLKVQRGNAFQTNQ